MEKTIYKICPRPEWESAAKIGTYYGSSDDVCDGFIHFSCASQLAGTLAKHFTNQTDLVLVSVPIVELGTELKWEASRGGQLFPHLYGNLNTALAIAIQKIEHGKDGHIIPDWPDLPHLKAN